jgi:Trypsin
MIASGTGDTDVSRRGLSGVRALTGAVLVLGVLTPLVGSSAAPAQAALSRARAHAVSTYRNDRVLTPAREGESRAHASIVGGALTSIGQVPWQVAVLAEVEDEGFRLRLLCGGSIVRDMGKVLTAGHCATNPFTGEPMAPEDLIVVAGVSSLAEEEIVEGPTSQARFVSGVRVHPYFDYAEGPGTPDDVAELELEAPLTPSAAVSLAGLPTSTIPPAEGSAATVSGFGEQGAEPEELDGNLYSLGLTVGFSRQCGGGANALFVCASAPGGTVCSGDSGGGLLAGTQLIGVVDTVAVVAGRSCTRGAEDGFANVTAPEVLDFVNGSESPPRAPQGGGAAIRGVIRAGSSLACEPGSWSGAPSFSYAFLSSAGGQVLQQGSSPTYPLTSADVGRAILCEVRATNAGGTGVGRTPPLPPIQPGPSVAGVSPIVPPAPSQSGEPPAGGALGAKAPKVGPAQLAALLRGALARVGKGARIASLERTGGFSLTLRAPEAGTATIALYASGSTASHGHAAKRLLLGLGRKRFAKAGKGRIVVALTAAGRRWLRGKARARVRVQGSFAAPGSAPVTVSKGFLFTQ